MTCKLMMRVAPAHPHALALLDRVHHGDLKAWLLWLWWRCFRRRRLRVNLGSMLNICMIRNRGTAELRAGHAQAALRTVSAPPPERGIS